MTTVERLREIVDGPLVGHEVNAAIAITRAIGGEPHDAGLRIVHAFPALLLVAEAARATVDSPLHTPELEPTVVFDGLRAAVAALDKQA